MKSLKKSLKTCSCQSREHRAAPRSDGIRTLFFGQISDNTTEQDFATLLGQFGLVADSIKFSRDPREKTFRGFVFVVMKSHADAAAALQHLKGQSMNGRPFHLDLAKRDRSRTPTPGQFMGIRKNRSSTPLIQHTMT